MNGRIARLFVLLSAILILSSCASVSKKFTPQTKANIGIFADQTISMLSDSDFGFTRAETLYTREFFDYSDEEEKKVIALRDEVEELFTRIVKYSLTMVQLVETNHTEAARVAAYHDYVVNMSREVLEKLGVEPERYDDIEKSVGAAEKFLDALQVAQPIINASVRYIHQILDLSDMAVDVLVEKLDRKIDEEYADVIWYQEKLEEEKYNILKSLAYLYGSYRGDMEAYALLSKSESLRKNLIVDPPASDDDLTKIADFLQARLNSLHLIENEIKADWETYRAAHNELVKLHEKTKRDNRKARLIALVWLRAHQKMASGIANPAEWLDIKSLPSTLINMGAKTLF